MLEQVCEIKEYIASGGVLVIENVVNGEKKKLDIIREIIEYTSCPGDSSVGEAEA